MSIPAFAHVGDVCAHESCSDYGKLQSDQPKKNFKKNGKTKKGRQRYLCKTCGQSFTETKGTLFYRSTDAGRQRKRSSRRWRCSPKACG